MVLAFNLFEIFKYRDHFCFFGLHVLSTFGKKYRFGHIVRKYFLCRSRFTERLWPENKVVFSN